MGERFRVGSLATLVQLLAVDGVGVAIEPESDSWSIGLTCAGGKGVWNFARARELPAAVEGALARARRGDHRALLASVA
jgi:hypothetical protein